jgi:hypothetical protein
VRRSIIQLLFFTAMADPLKPGQKHPTPTPGVGDRVFYETLLRQRPDSVMAQEWCVFLLGVRPSVCVCDSQNLYSFTNFMHTYYIGVLHMEFYQMKRLKSYTKR